MENDDRSSTASTVSGIYRNILQSPAPICMFYFAHPFGISTPPKSNTQHQSTNYRHQQTSWNKNNVRRQPTKTRDKYYHPNFDEHRIATYTPWPRNTWRRDYALPPLVQLLAVQKANQNVPDLETILKTIRSAWNTPKSRSVINSRACDFSESSSDSATNYRCSLKMGSGTNCTMVGPGLLRRRYSVPEIIMRKHTLAQQKSVDESTASSAPTPHHSPSPYKLNSSNSSTRSSGSDTNISRNGDRDPSMRRQLLRRMWSKEFRQYTESRSGSWSPPMRRSQRRLHIEVPDRCKECSKLEQTCELASPKRVRLNSPIASTACLQSSTNSTNSKRLTSSSELPVHTSCSSGTTETCSSSGGDAQHEINKNMFAYMASRETSSVDDNGGDDDDDDEAPELLQVETVNQMQPTPSTNSDIDDIVDSGHHEHDNAFINVESINNSRTEGEDNENVNDLSRNTNGHTTAETIEENGNNVNGVDQYVSELLVNSLNSLIGTVNEPMYITPNNITNYRRDSIENVTSAFKVDENENNSVASTDECNAYELIETKTDNAKQSEDVEKPIIIDDLDIENANTINVIDEERLIYFPQYTTESKDDESIYSTQLSEEEFLDSHLPTIIPVQTGSSYPNYDCTHATIVPRLVHRTESMEAEPSSASPREDHGGNDSDTSLVDSLDEPICVKSERAILGVTNETQPISTVIEKSQAFFVPIVDNNQQIDEHIDVASAMPEKLRDKLMKRQQELDTKKQQEINKKQKKIQKIINRNQGKELESSDKSNKSKSSVTSSPTIAMQNCKSSNTTSANTNSANTTSGNKTSGNTTSANTKGSKNKFLRSEIGMLESYRIDSRGNMQFIAPQKSEIGNSTIKRNSQTVKKAQPRKGDIITIKRSQTKKSTIDTNHRRKEVIKDVQHMTLYQVQPDLITPDTECGPRRMYQKTEIHDGEKRIEILEIVECVDSCSSADGSGESPHELTYRTRSATLMQKSKIPIPVYKAGQSIGFQKSVKCASRDGSSPRKIFIKNIQQLGNNTKVDQMIADLLIEALNHPKEMGIEFVKSPKEFSRGGSGNGKRPLISRRNMTGSRRSAGGTKYQQVFEVIPEEKSSFSVDSTTEESNISLNTATNNLLNESEGTSVRNISSSSAKESAGESKMSHNRIPRGKEAIQSDILTETEAWVGFFKQHDDSSVDSGNEDDQKRIFSSDYLNDSFQQKTVKVIEKPSKTIKQFNSPYSSSVFTPISSSDIFVSSSGSENIFTVIDKTFTDTPELPVRSVQFDTPNSVSTEQPYNKSTCTECHAIEKDLEENVKNNETEMKLGMIEPNESDDVDVSETQKLLTSLNVEPVEAAVDEVHGSCAQDESVWQVEDIKNYNPSKIDSQEPQLNATNVEIDSTSFIVLRDDENLLMKNAKSEDVLPNSRDRCVDCCFCNPNLHRRDGASSSTSCNFCNKQKPSSKSRDTETRSTNTARVYESLSKSDHTHIRTKSKESDTVSLKCTRTNSRIRRFIPEDTMNGNVCDDGDEKVNKNKSSKIDLTKKPPKPPTISPARKVNTETTSQSQRNNTKTTSGIRLPSPFVTGISSHSYDSTSSQCSSSSCSPCSPKKCPALPTGRWQNNGVQKQLNKTRASRYKDFYGDTEKKQMVNNNDNVSSPSQNTGWSLTLAGTYNDDMAPDVEMRLSFPKKNEKTDCDSSLLNQKVTNSHKQDNGNYHQYQREQSDVSNENYNLNNRAALPATGTANVNPKRTLSKTVIDKNRNIRNYNLPDLNPYNGTVAQQTARKTIKRSEYSVAVASATRTISNFTHGKQRAMSFQALNANAYRFDNRDRRRDHSVDLGHLSSRRMSIDSQTPTEAMALSVLGNAIAPEQKPRVPTMSERDLTRKHNSCFTRNRSFFS